MHGVIKFVDGLTFLSLDVEGIHVVFEVVDDVNEVGKLRSLDGGGVAD